MKCLIAIVLAITFAGCADMTPREKYWTGIAVGVVAAGAIAAHQQASGKPQTSAIDCQRTSDGVPQHVC